MKVPAGSTVAARRAVPLGGCVLPTVAGTNPATSPTTWVSGFWRAGHEFLGFPSSLFPDSLHPASSATEKKKIKARPNLANGVRPE